MGGYVRTRTLFGANVVTLDQHFHGQMTSLMQNFRHFWLNVKGTALAGLAPKLRQMPSIRKKQKRHNEMSYLEWVLRFDLRSSVLALGVKMYWSQVLFFQLKVFLQ